MLKKLDFQYRILILVGATLVPMVILACWGIADKKSTLNSASQTGIRVEVGNALSDYVHEVQKERGMSAAFIASKGKKFGDKLTDQRKATDEASQMLNEVLSHSHSIIADYETTLQSVVDRLSTIRPNVQPDGDKAAVVKRYTSIVNDCFSVSNNMLRGTRGEGTLKLGIAMQLLANAKESAGLERAVVAGMASSGKVDLHSRNHLVALTEAQSAYLNSFVNLAPSDLVASYQETIKSPKFLDAEAIRDSIMESNESELDLDPSVWWTAQTNKLGALRKLQRASTESLNLYVQESVSSASSAVFWMLLITLVPFLVAVTVSVWTIMSLRHGAQTLERSVRDIAEGQADLTAHLDEDDHELGRIAKQFNRVLKRLVEAGTLCEKRTGEIAVSSAQVKNNANSITKDLSRSKEASNVVVQSAAETQASIGGVATTIQAVSETLTQSSDQINRLTGDLRTATDQAQSACDVTGEAAKMVEQSSEQMSSLHSAAGEIEKVVDLIQDISEQTNLLSLNATIEAARAGEAGKGFAVVATEVKELAKQTGSAIEGIRDRVSGIQAATNRVDKTIAKIRDSFDNVRGVTTEISRTTSENSEVATEVRERMLSLLESAKEATGSIDSSVYAAGRISELIEEIDGVLHSAVQQSKDTSGAGQKLNNVAIELRDEMHEMLSLS